jgi:hypothetical protein
VREGYDNELEVILTEDATKFATIPKNSLELITSSSSREILGIWDHKSDRIYPATV